MTLDHLRGAFGGLSEAHHQILVMRELEGLSYRQIGEKLGMSRPSVESTLFRARRRLSEEYEELVSGERCRRIQGIIAGATGARLGVRDERKMARHVSYCQPCRRAAFAAGFDPATLTPKRSVREKIAALLPVPVFAKRWIAGRAADHSSLFSAAAHYGESTSSGWVKAAAAVAALAIAGMGADAVVPHRGHATTDGRTPAVAPAPAAATKTISGPQTTTTSAQHSVAGAISSHGQSKHHGSSASSSTGTSSGTSSGSSPSMPSSQGSSSGSSSSAGKGASSDGSDPVKKVTKPITDKLPNVGGATGTSTPQAPQLPNVKVPDVQVPTVQVPDVQVPTVPGAPPAVNGAVGAVNGAANQATGAVNGAAGQVTGGVNGVVHHATDTVNNTTSTATGTVNKVTGGILGGG
jgi:hypothetical protein